MVQNNLYQTTKDGATICRTKNDFCQQQFAKMAGFGLNLKLVLYLQSQCLTESLCFLNPPLLQAAKRYAQAEKRHSKMTMNRERDYITL